MTPIEYHFIAPDGDPIANTDVEFILLAPAFDPQEPGILLPRVVVVTTNEFGNGVVNLASVDVQYQVVIYDLRSDAALSYKFYVPDPTPGLTFRLQDLIVAGPISETTYDEAAILAIQNAKVNAMAAAAAAEASKVAAMGYATTASNSVGAVIAAKDAAILSKDAAAVSASEAVTNKNIAVAKALEATNKATEALGHATLAETRANSTASNAASAVGSAASATLKAAEAETSKNAAVAASNSAETAQSIATTKATEAAASVISAAASASVATAKEAQALAAANAANSSLNDANDAANLATLKASAAAWSATGAANSAGTAVTKATESAASAVVAGNKASEAAASAVLATSRIDEAAASAILAQNSATLAGTKATESTGSATASAASAALSLTREQMAKKWAEEELGIAVEPGKYSAKHWANQAQASATGSMVYRGAFSAAAGTYPANPKLGDYYKISVGGTLPLIGSVAPTDSIIYNGTGWDKIDSTDAVTSVAGRVGAVVLSKTDVGLPNVDNTSDANKPVSSAQLAALNAKASLSSPEFTGNATLDGKPFVFPPIQYKVSEVAIQGISDVEYRLLNPAATTVTLPIDPKLDDNISWVSDNGRTDNVLARNGQLVNGIAEDVVLDAPSGSLRYVGNSRGWIPSEDRFRSSGTVSIERAVAALFANGEQGGWYDPSDISTLFQDTAGAAPVTAVEQPVGLMLDKSGRGNHATQVTTTKRSVYSRRVNALVNTENPSAWPTNGITRTAEAGGVSLLQSTIDNSGVFPGLQYPIGATPVSNSCIYRSIEYLPGDALYMAYGPAAGASFVTIRTSDGVVVGAAGGTSPLRKITPLGDGWVRVETWDSLASHGSSQVSSFLHFGNTFGGLYITTTDQAGTQLRVRRPQYVVLPFGSTHSVQYQRVNTNTDYDADPDKFPAYLRGDGVDDAMQTGNIDFTGTDKMTVWAGVAVSRSSDQSGIYELGVNSTTSNGLSMQCMGSLFATLRGQAFGTSRGVVDAPGFALNTPYQVCAQYDLSAALVKDEIRLRKNGAYVSSPTLESSGAGNFSSYPLTIMARGTMTAYTGGRLYSLIIRGAQSSLSQIEATEAYIKQKMRLP